MHKPEVLFYSDTVQRIFFVIESFVYFLSVKNYINLYTYIIGITNS
ncbi:hypothetical protein C7972_12911 [Arenibacter sp. ARW7G5Y1]|nr:hypothetical protein C7972_12911 [Arenibacter sp. ARW7G5Y1]